MKMSDEVAKRGQSKLQQSIADLTSAMHDLRMTVRDLKKQDPNDLLHPLTIDDKITTTRTSIEEEKS